MKKAATSTPKEIAKRRLAKHPIMKIPLHERNNITNKENLIPEIIPKQPLKTRIRDRESFYPRNPFDLPQIDRVFTKCKKPKKPTEDPVTELYAYAVRDIDDSFFKIVEGRPLRHADDIKVYMSNIRDICLYKANAAYLLDRILQIDAKLSFEMEEYIKVVHMLKQLKSAFTQFVEATYHKCKKLQMIGSMRTFALNRKMEELSIISDEYVLLRNELIDIFLTFENLALYRKFLHKLTPVWWIMQQYGEDKDFFAAAAENSALSRQISVRSGGSIEINVNKVDYGQKADAQLYFVEPEQLLTIFEDYRIQCLDYLTRTGWSSNILTTVLKGRNYLRALVEEEEEKVQSLIDIYNNLIKFEEEKEISLKTAFEKILMSEFKELFASFDASKFTCIQYVNRKIFGTMEDPKDNISTLTANIENHYMELLLDLDYLDIDVVKNATKQAFDEDKLKMKRAYKAKRIIKECDILRRSLYTSFEPPRNKMKNVKAKQNLV